MTGAGGGTGGPEDTLADKLRLRERMLAARRALDPARRAALSRDIADHVTAMEAWNAARTVHAYIGAREGEVETRELVQRALDAGKVVACPRVALQPRRLESLAIASLEDLVLTLRRLWEPDPAVSPPVDPAAIDLVLVPGLAFDRHGGRLGFGAGYYDRFLPTTDALRVGLAFSLQLVDRVPVTPNDVPVHWLATEQAAIACRAARHVSVRDAMP